MKREPIYHLGAAEALGVTEAQLERMTIRETVGRAFDLGLTVEVHKDGGVGPGLTLRGPESNEVVA